VFGLLPLPPDWVMPVSTLFAYVGLCEESMDSKYCMWAVAACSIMTALGGRGFPVTTLPLDWVVHATLPSTLTYLFTGRFIIQWDSM
jgi:hypothetical protein